jgi:transcriptional regulator with XRE-family HTH domain
MLRTLEPSLRSRWFGRQMRTLREDHGFTLRYAERVTGIKFAALKAVEQGLHHIQVSQVVALLELYGVADKQDCDWLLELARDVRHLQRWEDHTDAPPLSPTMLDLLWLESHARQIRCYSTTLIPPLLQVSEYAEAAASTATSGRHASWWGWACTERQRVLDGPPQAELHAVVAETALARPPSRRSQALHRQLRHLAESARLPHITVQVLPSAAPYSPGAGGSFQVFELVAPCGPVAAVHGLVAPMIHEEQHAYQYIQVFEQLSATALDLETSVALITEAAENLA